MVGATEREVHPWLRAAGHATRVAPDAKSALAALGEESADLVFHLVVALHQRGVPLARVMDELRRRRGGSPAPERSDA